MVDSGQLLLRTAGGEDHEATDDVQGVRQVGDGQRSQPRRPLPGVRGYALGEAERERPVRLPATDLLQLQEADSTGTGHAGAAGPERELGAPVLEQPRPGRRVPGHPAGAQLVVRQVPPGLRARTPAGARVTRGGLLMR